MAKVFLAIKSEFCFLFIVITLVVLKVKLALMQGKRMNRFANSTRQQIVAAMADGMRRHGDGCTGAHLKLLGFSQDQIDRHGDAARELAMARSEPIEKLRSPAKRAA